MIKSFEISALAADDLSVTTGVTLQIRKRSADFGLQSACPSRTNRKANKSQLVHLV
jgi:hypothetical protein